MAVSTNAQDHVKMIRAQQAAIPSDHEKRVAAYTKLVAGDTDVQGRQGVAYARRFLTQDATPKELYGTSDYAPVASVIWDAPSGSFIRNPNVSTWTPGTGSPSPAGGGASAAAGAGAPAPSGAGGAAPSGGGVSGNASNVLNQGGGASASGIVSTKMLTPEQVKAYNPFGHLDPSLDYQAATSEVDPNTETAEGRLLSLMNPSSPLVQRAQALNAGQFSGRGLVNSTMRDTAGTAAVIDTARPIAMQDAQTYSDRAVFNTNAVNEAGMFRAGETNKLVGQGADIASRFGLQQNEFQFNSQESALDRESQERLTQMKIASDQALSQAELSHSAAMTELKIAASAAETDKSIAAQDRLAEAQRNFQVSENELNRAHDLDLQVTDQAFRTDMLNTQQAFAGQENQLDRENQERLVYLQSSLANANIPKAQASEIAANLARDISTIAASPDMDSAAKRTQINNLYDGANASIQTISSLYNTELVGVGDVGKIVPNPPPPEAPAPVAPGNFSGI